MDLAYYDIPSKELHIDMLLIKKGALILRAFNHNLRQQMLKLMDKRRELTVTEIFTELNLEQPVASQQLAILRRAGFVKTSKKGKKVYYSVNYDRVMQVQYLLKEFLH
jgi:ArsR family transcriptional regulator, virulence genes transcriptional regulator